MQHHLTAIDGDAFGIAIHSLPQQGHIFDGGEGMTQDPLGPKVAMADPSHLISAAVKHQGFP